MWQSIANIILRNRFIIIGVITLMTVFFGYHALTGLKLDNKYGILLPKNAQAKIDLDKFNEIIKWLENNIGKHERHCRWGVTGDDLISFKFRYERDYIMFTLRWS